jgi:Recombination endonuclease VII
MTRKGGPLILPHEKEQKLEQQRQRRAGQRSISTSLRQLGFTQEDYVKFEKAQGNKCAICNKPPNKVRLALDHDHGTGKARGLLCYSCNTKLGWLESHMHQISDYLAKGGIQC